MRLRFGKPRSVGVNPRVLEQRQTWSCLGPCVNLKDLAQKHTKPPPKKGCKDTEEVKELFRRAKRIGSKQAWKQAHRSRKIAHDEWKQAQLLEATSGNWKLVRDCRPSTNVGCEIRMAEALAPHDPNDQLHDHYRETFRSKEPVCLPTSEPSCRSPDFSEDELMFALSKGKLGKSVGNDGVSLELLRAISEDQGGRAQLLAWFHSLLHTGELPPHWLVSAFTESSTSREA